MEPELKFLHDQPLAPDKLGSAGDIFSFLQDAQRVAEYIRTTPGPAVIHVDGAWGTGKTSFCNQVVACCSGPIVGVTTFVSTQHEGTNTPERAIMCVLASSILCDDRAKALDRVDSLTAYAAAGVADANGKVDAFEQWLREALVLGAAKRKAAETQSKTEKTEAQNKTVKLYLDEAPPFEKVLVVIDDLDRSNPEFVAGVFDTIKRFVNTEGLYFLVAADRQVLVNAIAARADSWKELDISPEYALEKYIRLTVKLSDFSTVLPDRVEDWLDLPPQHRDLLSPNGKLEEGQDLSFWLPKFVVAVMGNGITPRELKRLINQVTLSLERWEKRNGWKGHEEGLKRERVQFWINEVFTEVVRKVWPQAWPSASDPYLRRRLTRVVDLGFAFDDRTCISLVSGTLGNVMPPKPFRFWALCQLAYALEMEVWAKLGVEDKAGSTQPHRGGWRNYAEGVSPPIKPIDNPKNDLNLETLNLKNTHSRDVALDDSEAGREPAPYMHAKDGASSRIKARTDDELDIELQTIETEVDGSMGSSESRVKLERALKLVSVNFAATSPIQVGNLAVSAELADCADIAWQLHSLQRDHGRFDNNPKLFTQYISFLVDYKQDRLPQPDPKAASDDPVAVAEYWLGQADSAKLDLDLKTRVDRLQAELAIRKARAGGADTADSVQLAISGLLNQYVNAPTRDGARGLLSLAPHFEDAPGLVRKIIDAFKKNHQENDEAFLGIVRAAADALASLDSAEAKNDAIQYYEKLETSHSSLWNPDTKHNLATLLFNVRDEEERPLQLWTEAYAAQPKDRTIRRAFAQLLKRRGRSKEAVKVLEGKPL